MGCEVSTLECWQGIVLIKAKISGKGDRSVKDNDTIIGLDNFSPAKKVLGLGGFGCVRITRKLTGVDKNKLYALKSLSKNAVLLRSSGISSVMSELKALALLVDAAYICNVHYAFQDDVFLYMAIDLAEGGDMRYNLRISPNCRFKESRAQFYVAQLMLAVACCHSASILHRGNIHISKIRPPTYRYYYK